jgi:PPE-repeat protein
MRSPRQLTLPRLAKQGSAVVFAFFPPEVNSGLMYTGPGSGPLAATAAAWDSLATELYSTASSYQSVLSDLTSGWSGPSAVAMAGAAAPYVSWMSATASQAAHAGAQVKAAAAGYEAAFAMTVPPAVVASNRALLAALVATNIFGQNTPAIAATEAQYQEMWAQDVAAMSGYATSANTAAQLSAFNTPPATTNVAAATTPAAGITDGASVLAVLTNLGTGVQAGLSSLSTSGPLSGVLGSLGTVLGGTAGTALTQEAPTVAQFAMTPAQMLIQLGSSLSQNGGSGLASSGSEELLTTIGNFVDSKMQLVMGGISNQLQSFGSAVSAQLAHASQLGGLSIPPGWSATAQGLSRAAPVLPPSSVSTPALSQATAMPPSPLAQGLMGALNGQGPTSITGKMPSVKLFARSPAGG